mmetsp:Transcript_118365/g.328990  ORF Transcript_118365/g.328990 Transcript_118365/m.328990 type:complete len:265 (+) Transcript_118365:76-870(+)
MAAMPEMLSELTEREKERFSSEQEAQAGIRAVKEKVSAAAEELMALRRAQDHEVGVVKAQYEKRIRDTVSASRQRVRHAQGELVDAEAQMELSNRGLKLAEAEVAVLQKRAAQLQAQLAERNIVGEQWLQELQCCMDERVARITAQTDTRVASMKDHTEMVRRSCLDAVHAVRSELQDQLSRASMRAEGRTRFLELCDLAGRCAGYEMTQDSYQELKAELVGLWQLQKSMRSAAGPVLLDASLAPSEATMLPGAASPDPFPAEN